VKTVASKNQGVVELDAAIEKHLGYLKSSGELDRRNRERVRIRIETMLKEKFMDRLLATTPQYEELLDEVVHKRNNPHDAAMGLLSRVRF
jgi:LAO/AO transport system kinase